MTIDDDATGLAAAVLRIVRFARRSTGALVLLLLATVGIATPAAGAASADGKADAADASRLPAFEGRTLDGKRLATSSFAGKRLVLLCFNPGVEQSVVYAQALARVATERRRHNFEVAGVAMGLDPASKREFVAAHGLDFPILDDSDGDIAARLGLQSPVMLVGTDGEGRVGLAMLGFENGEEISATTIEGRIREYLRLDHGDDAADGRLEVLPAAPVFEAPRVSRGEPFRLADAKGRPVVLTFFLSTCRHCQDALGFFQAELARVPEKSRPVFVGIATDTHTYGVEAELRAKGISFFPVYEDPGRRIAEAYGSFARVPDIVMIDASGRIVHRRTGWNEKRDPDVMRMVLARLAGTKVPMLLARDGYSGNDACAVCHPQETAAWRFTEHSLAFDTLVTRGADRDPKCVGCHVVGFGDRGGWTEAGREAHLENVGCESCHGRGGGHLDAKGKPTEAVAARSYQPSCERCHDATHSLGFEYASFLPKVSHAAILAMGDAARAELVAGRDRPRDLLPATSAIVGSQACKRCHEQEYAAWSRSAHARSVRTLEIKGKNDEAGCVRCHVTGYGRAGGFAEDARARHGEDLARVGCESCHGPGEAHVKAEGKSPAGIVALADKCESCVILQICGSCHDDANDPGFRFDVARKIDVQRHGTTKKASPAAGKGDPKG